MQSIKLVTFDATNTFLKFKIPPWQYYKNIAQDYGFHGTPRQLRIQLSNSLKKMYAEHPNFGKNDLGWVNWWKELVRLTFIGLVPPTTDIDHMAVKLIDEFRTDKCWAVSEGSQQLMELLKAEGKCVGVISNFDVRLIEILENVKFASHFNFVLTSYEAGYCKPDKRIFDAALGLCHLSPHSHECLHIGDNLEKDYLGAKHAGWNALLVNPSCTPKAPGQVYRNINQLTKSIMQNKISL